MKRIIMLALVLTTLATTAFSNIGNAIDQRILNTFTQSFAFAEDVRWEVKKDMYKVSFKVAGQQMYAYYNQAGEELAISRNIMLTQLPINLSGELQKTFGTAWLTSLFEVSANGNSAYYATVQDADYVTTWKAEVSGSWIVLKKEKK